MEQKEEKKDSMDLKLMLYAGLRRWKEMIIGGVIIAILFGIYAVYSSISASRDSYANWNEVVQIRDSKIKYSNSMEKAELDNVTVNKKISDQQEYLDKSIYIKLDPYDINCAEAEYYISTDYKILPGMDYQNRDFTDTVASSYVSLLSSADIVSKIAEDFGTESRYLKEIFDIGVSNRILTIRVIHSDANTAQKILDDFISYLTSIGEDISGSIAEHTLSLINRTSYSYINLDLIDVQNEQTSLLQSLNQTKTENDNIIDDATYNLRELEKDEAALANSTDVTRKTIKYVIIGLLGGMILAYAYGCFVYIIGGRLYIADEFSERTGLRIIGRLASGRNKNAVDKLICRMEGRVYDRADDDEYRVIASNIMGMKDKYSSIFVTGSIDDSKVGLICEKISPMLKDITVKSGSDILNNPDAVNGISDCEAVLLVEQCGTSKYSVVFDEISKAEWFGKKVIGCVVIE